MRSTEKDKNWITMMEHLGALRLFFSQTIRKSTRGAVTSAQEADMLFRVALAKAPITPGRLSLDMGVSKTTVSRLIDSLSKKGFLQKEYQAADSRSYSLTATESGKEELDAMYYYYLDPLYVLQQEMGEEDFKALFDAIEKANEIMKERDF